MARGMDRLYAGLVNARCRSVVLAVLLILGLASVTIASPRPQRDPVEAVTEALRTNMHTLEASLPQQEAALREAQAALERRSEQFAQGRITREMFRSAAGDVVAARARLEETKRQLTRSMVVIAEIEARRHLASLPALGPGQYDASGGFVRYAGRRAFDVSARAALARHFGERVNRALPISAEGQSNVHTRLGLDHRHAVDLAVHPDSPEGRLVMAWLREHDIPFLAFRGARAGAATGAHIHVGAPSERAHGWAVPTAASASSDAAARSSRR
jgi:hypothetical protein